MKMMSVLTSIIWRQKRSDQNFLVFLSSVKLELQRCDVISDFCDEQLLVHLQLYWNVAVHFLFGWQEVTDHVIAVTKALSKRPYK